MFWVRCTGSPTLFSGAVGRYYGTSTPKFRFKLYPDVVAYFSYLASIAVLATLAHLSPPVREALRRRMVPSWKVSSSCDPLDWFAYGASVGEVLLVTSWCGLFAWWVYYFGYAYPRPTNEARSTSFDGSAYPACCPPPFNTTSGTCTYEDPHADLGLVARVTGELSTFFISFLLYPVSRNSIWSYAFGVGHDQVWLTADRSARSCCGWSPRALSLSLSVGVWEGGIWRVRTPLT